MRILIAEDESDISHTYRIALESRGHEVTIANNGIRCIEIYREESKRQQDFKADKISANRNNSSKNPNLHDFKNSKGLSPFDAVVLDYKMPGKDGMEVAKEILNFNPDQRIVFASAYVEETLADSVKQLKRVVELLQKPFEIQAFIDTIEDKEVYQELKKIFVNIRAADQGGTSHVHPESGDQPLSTEQIRDMFECLRKIQKNRTF